MSYEVGGSGYSETGYEEDGAYTYWSGLAQDLVSVGEFHPSDPEHIVAYRLYILGVMAAVDQDIANGAHGNRTELLNSRFHLGIKQAVNRTGANIIEPFASQDLDSHGWHELLSHQIAPSIRLHSGVAMPASYLELLKQLEQGAASFMLGR